MKESTLSQREIRRYSRQIMLPEIGLSGQEKLKKSKVLVVGAGGLGCPVLQYLAAAGTGRLAIAEFDTVNESNLQRQILYGSADIGKLKSIIAAGRIEMLNDLIETERINLKIDRTNSLRILSEFDIVVDATDNFAARYMLSDSCVILGLPLVHGAIYKYEGQVSVFNYKGGPTYRCYNAGTALPKYGDPSPAETGLLGVLPGITGTIMANVVIKIITGYGSVLSGKILVLNIKDYEFSLLEIPDNPENHKRKQLDEKY